MIAAELDDVPLSPPPNESPGGLTAIANRAVMVTPTPGGHGSGSESDGEDVIPNDPFERGVEYRGSFSLTLNRYLIIDAQ